MPYDPHIVGKVAVNNIIDGAESADLVDSTRVRAMALYARSLEENAENWRLLMEHGFMSVLGSAGFAHPEHNQKADPNGYRHFGLNFWSMVGNHDAMYEESVPYAHKLLKEYLEVLKQLPRKRSL